MPIRFQCTNIVSYDAATGAYVRCGCELTAPETDIAKYVQCPRCHGRALVPPQNETAKPLLDSPQGSTSYASSPAVASQPTATAPSTSTLKFSTFDSKHRCTRCGGALGEDFRCLVCKYQNILKVDTPPIEKVKIQSAGCQRWLGQKLAHGIGASHLLLAAHSLVAIFLIIIVTSAFGLGGSAAWIVLAIVAVVGLTYAYVVFEFRRIASRAPATLNWWQRWLWSFVLLFYRARNWRPFNSSATWKVLDMRNKPFDDRYITSLPDITRYHVLDLEGTALTDAGLLKLQGLKMLQRLVVRHTKVSQDAVFHLQQRLPNIWIWN